MLPSRLQLRDFLLVSRNIKLLRCGGDTFSLDILGFLKMECNVVLVESRRINVVLVESRRIYLLSPFALCGHFLLMKSRMPSQ